jgi:hypothetical protein
MKLNKVCTIRKTGNYVRFFLLSVLLAVVVVSCDKLGSESDDPRDNLVGVWYCNESGTGGNSNFQVVISKSATDSTRILIGNFSLLGNDVDVYAKLNGLSITVPSQTAGGSQVSGSGTVSSNYKSINWTYTVSAGGTTEHYTAAYSK